MSKVRLQCLDIRCHEEVGMEMNPKLCTHLHTPRSPATGRQSWGSLSFLHPPGEEHCILVTAQNPHYLFLMSVICRTHLRSGSHGLIAGRPWI